MARERNDRMKSKRASHEVVTVNYVTAESMYATGAKTNEDYWVTGGSERQKRGRESLNLMDL